VAGTQTDQSELFTDVPHEIKTIPAQIDRIFSKAVSQLTQNDSPHRQVTESGSILDMLADGDKRITIHKAPDQTVFIQVLFWDNKTHMDETKIWGELLPNNTLTARQYTREINNFKAQTSTKIEMAPGRFGAGHILQRERYGGKERVRRFQMASSDHAITEIFRTHHHGERDQERA
jgi:hypothetical protein